MKRILIAVIFLLGIAGIGVQYTRYSSTSAVVSQLMEQINETNARIEECNATISESALSRYASNSEMVSAVMNTDDSILKLVQIIAQNKNEVGQYKNIVTVTTIEETAYFTNTISRIVINAEYKDFQKTYEYLGTLDVPFAKIEFDTKNKMVSLYLTSLTAGDSDISSEFTVSGSDVSSDTESSDLNEILPEESTQSEEFDIQYLGGDQ